MNYFVNLMGFRCAFYIPELWFLIGPEDG